MFRVTCPYCGRDAHLTTGLHIYNQRRFDLAHKKFWVCRPCKAWVGCHTGGSFASRIADAALVADARNKDRLLAAFPELFEKYGPGSDFYKHLIG